MDIRITLLAGLGLATSVLGASTGLAQTPTIAVPLPALPPLKPQKTPQAVIDEHFDALNKCDWARLMAQYPADAQFFLPLGQTIVGRDKLAQQFAQMVKPHDQGGICGAKFTPEHTFVVGDTISIQWVVTADFLSEPYRGSDAYITRNGLMAAIVTSFQGAQLKTRKP
jgi:hypothetical protein